MVSEPITVSFISIPLRYLRPETENETREVDGTRSSRPSRRSVFRYRWVADATVKMRAAGYCGAVTIMSLCAQMYNLANGPEEPQIVARREPQTMGLNLWSNVTL